jgi:UDP-N-acetylglucosamine 2-epimerase (non-hydrolysing)
MEAHGIQAQHVRVIPPQSYIDFLALMSSARLVLTDSGGIQEETTILGVTCLTLRENTERPVTIEQGTNRLVGTDPQSIFQAAEEALAAPPASGRRPPLWDGQAAVRIVETLERAMACRPKLGEAVSSTNGTGPSAARMEKRHLEETPLRI